MSAVLVGGKGKLAGRDFAVGDLARVGGAPDADVRLQAQGVSREHARIWKDDDAYWIEDRESTNGTFVNGERVRKLRLRHLDVVTFGRDLDMIFMEREARPTTRFRPAVQGARIEWLDGPEEGQSEPLQRGETTIGRAPACTLIVTDTRISKLHARIVRERDRVTVEDLGSTNGTWVGDRRISEPRELADGDRVSLGGLELRVHMDIDADATQVRQAAVTDTAYGSTDFDQTWRTKLVWSNEELEELEQIRQSLKEEPEAPEEIEEPEAEDGEDAAADDEAPHDDTDAKSERAVPDDADDEGEAEAEAASGEDREAEGGGSGPAEQAPAGVTRRTVSVGKAAHERAPRTWALRRGDDEPVRLSPGTMVVGRDPAADLRIDEAGVSRQHARMGLGDGELWVEDLGSVNGTKVNGERIEDRTRLTAGDEVAFAGEVYRVEETDAS